MKEFLWDKGKHDDRIEDRKAKLQAEESETTKNKTLKQAWQLYREWRSKAMLAEKQGKWTKRKALDSIHNLMVQLDRLCGGKPEVKGWLKDTKTMLTDAMKLIRKGEILVGGVRKTPPLLRSKKRVRRAARRKDL